MSAARAVPGATILLVAMLADHVAAAGGAAEAVSVGTWPGPAGPPGEAGATLHVNLIRFMPDPAATLHRPPVGAAQPPVLLLDYLIAAGGPPIDALHLLGLAADLFEDQPIVTAERIDASVRIQAARIMTGLAPATAAAIGAPADWFQSIRISAAPLDPGDLATIRQGLALPPAPCLRCRASITCTVAAPPSVRQ